MLQQLHGDRNSYSLGAAVDSPHRAATLRAADDTRELSTATQIASLQRDLLRSTTQLSAMRDECEALERKTIRLEAQAKTTSAELDEREEGNRRLRRELDEVRRQNHDLAASKTELLAARDGLQGDLQQALENVAQLKEELERKAEAATVQSAIVLNLQEQNRIGNSQIQMAQEQRQQVEEEVRRLQALMSEQARIHEAFKASAAKEADRVAQALERCLHKARQHPSDHAASGDDDSDAFPFSTSTDHDRVADSSRMHQHPTKSATAATNTTTTAAALRASGDASTLWEVHRVFSSLYQARKSLHHFVQSVQESHAAHEHDLAAARQSCSTTDEALHATVAESRGLHQRVLLAESHVTRLQSQLESTRRNMEDETAKHTELLAALRTHLGTPSGTDAIALESHVRLLCNERDQSREKICHLQDTVTGLKSEVVRCRQDAEERLDDQLRDLTEKHKYEIQALHDKISALTNERNRLMTDADVARQHHEGVVAALRAELDAVLVQHQRTVHVVDTLEPAHRALARQVPELQQQVSFREREVQELRNELVSCRQQARNEIEVLRRRLGPYGSAAVASDGSIPTICSPFELLVLTLRVLHGAQRDLSETFSQRRALTKHLLEYERIFGPLSLQFSPHVSLRCALRFRAAVVAVIAANRLRRLTRNLRFLRERVYSSHRRSLGSVRVSADTLVVVHGGVIGVSHPLNEAVRSGSVPCVERVLKEEEFALPSAAETRDVPLLIHSLLERVKGPPAGLAASQSAWALVAPSVVQHLQSSLQRLYLHYGRMGMAPLGGATAVAGHTGSRHPQAMHSLLMSSPSRGPSLVYPVTGAPFQTPAPRAATSHVGGQQFGAGGFPRSAANRINMSGDLTAHGMEFHGTAPPRLPSHGSATGREEFATEVLNVIRALDTKVAGALKLHRSERELQRSGAANANRSGHHYK